MNTIPAPSLRRRRPDARPDEILDAALDAFLDRGFEATRMEDVAGRAGLSSKEALLKALIVRSVKPIADQAEALAAGSQQRPLEALTLIVAAVTARLEDPRVAATPRLVLLIAPRFPELVAFYRDAVVDRARAAVEALVRAGIAQRLIRPVDPDSAARLIIGPLVMGALLRHVLQAEAPPPDPGAHLDLVLRGLAA
jgi:AcrR family transcriptional regulator